MRIRLTLTPTRGELSSLLGKGEGALLVTTSFKEKEGRAYRTELPFGKLPASSREKDCSPVAGCGG